MKTRPEQFAQQFARLVATFMPVDKDPRQTARRCQEYHEALADIPPQVLPKVVSRAIQNCKWFPSPAELREIWLSSPYGPAPETTPPSDATAHEAHLTRSRAAWARFLALPDQKRSEITAAAKKQIAYDKLKQVLGAKHAEFLLKQYLMSRAIHLV